MWYICTMEYYKAMKNNNFMKFTGNWMELEKKIILSQVTQTHKDEYDMYVIISRYLPLNDN